MVISISSREAKVFLTSNVLISQQLDWWQTMPDLRRCCGVAVARSCGALVIGIAFGFHLCSADERSQSKKEFVHDFRSPQLHPALALTGPNVASVAKSDGKGLRVRIPKNQDKPRTIVGISPKFVLSGDFEVVAGYELLSVDSGPVDAGVNLRAVVGSPMQDAVGVARCVRDEEGEIFAVNKASAANGDKNRRRSSTYPSKWKFGKLRLLRKGSTLFCSVVDGPGNDFRPFDEFEISGADCEIRLVALTGDKQSVDVRFVDLQIQAEDLPTSVLAEPSTGNWITILLIGSVSIATAAIVIYLALRLRRRYPGF